jgi:hypothetical protein
MRTGRGESIPAAGCLATELPLPHRLLPWPVIFPGGHLALVRNGRAAAPPAPAQNLTHMSLEADACVIAPLNADVYVIFYSR